MTDDYDAADNARKCYDVAIQAMREKLHGFRQERIGDCWLINADCREVLPLLPKVDVVLSDPPYGNDDTHAGHLSSIVLRSGEPARQALGFDGISADDFQEMVSSWCDISRR